MQMMWGTGVVIILNLVFVLLGIAWFVAVLVLLYKIYQNTKPRL